MSISRMNTREVAAEYRLAHWAEIMHRRKESGLSIKSFCEIEGFHENIYYYWQRKLREAACQQINQEQGTHPQTGIVPSGFTELKVMQTQGRRQPWISSQGELRIEYGGIKLTADSAYPAKQLLAIVGELRGLC